MVSSAMASGPYSKTGPATTVHHPNRELASEQLTRGVVALLLIASNVQMNAVTAGGWSAHQGQVPITAFFIHVYAIKLEMVLRWRRGALPVTTAFAVVLGIIDGISITSWFVRAHPGFTQPALPENVVGALCAILVPVQLLLILFAMRAFGEGWNVEEEVPISPYHQSGLGRQPHPA